MIQRAPAAEAGLDNIIEAIHRREPIRSGLPGGGRVTIDRNLPFLIVYRQPLHEDPGTARIVMTEASYLIAGTDDDIGPLVRRFAEAGSEEHGAFLVLEVWAGDDHDGDFVIHRAEGPAPATVATLERGLADLRPDRAVRVEVADERHPPSMEPLLTIRECWDIGCLLIGLEVPPVYRSPDTGKPYPVYFRTFRRELSRAIRQALYEFVRVQTPSGVQNYKALGTRTLDDSIWAADRELSAIERSYQFLLLVAAVNEKQAWHDFRRSDYTENPEFHYRLLPVDPDLLKRRLFAIAIDEVDDPAMAFLLRDKREELDKQISMLEERGTDRFLFSSMRLYGRVDEPLLELAEKLLDQIQIRPREETAAQPADASHFLERAKAELRKYEDAFPDIANRAEIRPDMSGLLVSEGNLLIGHDLLLSPDRVDALIQHEVGTHMITYANGSAQPLEQLSLGLADYDELQEGIAVFAEYLVGGLDRGRMRLLAGRVIAAHSVEQGAEFVETFRILKNRGFSAAGAYGITARVHVGGGFTRDLIYLRGLVRLLEYLKGGGELERLYIGKLALKHLEMIGELRDRRVLIEPPLRPSFLGRPEVEPRIRAAREGISLAELIRAEAA